MKALLTMVAAAALVLGGCSSESADPTAPQSSTPAFSCAGGANQPGNQPCNGQQGGGGGGGNNNNSNNPPTTAP
jgi:hypothetical protein